MHGPNIERVLLSSEVIQERVRTLAEEISEVYGDDEILAVGVLTGAFVFLADLMRNLENPIRFAFLKATSYRDGTRPGQLELNMVGETDVADRDVLVVEDILDSGRSLTGILEFLRKGKPRSLRTVVLLDKPARRAVDFQADFVGFEVPDEFIVGYGLDHAERYRNLPYVGVIRPPAEESGA